MSRCQLRRSAPRARRSAILTTPPTADAPPDTSVASSRTPRALVPRLLAILLGTVAAAGSAAACEEGQDTPSADEIALLSRFELAATEIPASPTNAFADDAAASELGRALFFDRRMSSDGGVACVDCHDPARGFADARALSLGVEGQAGRRHALPVTDAALQPFLLWDGRADSVWRQPLLALENPREMNFTRVEVARLVASAYAEPYVSVFGALPDLSGAPLRGHPGDPAWDALDEAQRDAIQRVFVNVGKAIEAYERKLTCVDTRFDQWARGEIELSASELDGAARFVRSGCTNCHKGIAFSDGAFHNLGLSPANVPAPDNGRPDGLSGCLTDELNAASVYSDDPVAGAARLVQAKNSPATVGAFRTASLRGATQRARFGHTGEHTDLEDFINDTYRRRGGRGGRGGRGDGDGDGDGGAFIGALDPLLDGVDVDGDAGRIVTFLRTLECPAPPAALLAP
ncbi:MAG: cytochrome c peroxidase [Polyangiaceae bacterium]